MVAGLPLTSADIDPWLARRQAGYGRGGRMKIEQDRVEIVSGVRGGSTLGSPIGLRLINRDYANWEPYMRPGGLVEPGKEVTRPRPGHTDLAGGIKYRHRDLRNVLERSSARETAARVAAGAVAIRFLEVLGIRVAAHVVALGAESSGAPFDWGQVPGLDASPVRCLEAAAAGRMTAAIDAARERGDTLGGVVEVRFGGVPTGVGSHVHWDRRLDGRLGQAALSVHAIKAVEIGDGWHAARAPGSQVQDEIFHETGRGYFRRTNRAGGLEGGVSNGEDVVIRAAMKPLSTLMKPLSTVDITDHSPQPAAVERSDVTAVPAASIAVLGACALTLADALLETFGGDRLEEVQDGVERRRREAEAF
jgi:chorismate synthase